ncbi:MAG: class I SAM-dependent methyltransferase [Gammaproteobacteria bacterium]
MSLYEHYVLPHALNLACGFRAIRKQREKVVPAARGEVLEIGFGSGLNLPYYDMDKVSRIWALEPSEGMRHLARKRLQPLRTEFEFIDLPGEEIPLADASVDTVLCTFTLCTIPDTAAALAGMRRVLRPGGRLLFCEHGLAPDEGGRRWQKRLEGPWSRIAGGCRLTRDIPALIRDGGFRIDEEDSMYVPGGPKTLSWQWWGSATPR